jgi:hypothetical protein
MDTQHGTNVQSSEDRASALKPESLDRSGAERAVLPELNLRDRRKIPRYEMSAKVTIVIFAQLKSGSNQPSESGRMKLVREGFSLDLSPYGLCVALDGRPTGIELQQLVGQTAKIKLDLNRPGEPELNILGRIAWAKEEAAITKVGIQFTDVPPADREVLVKHCTEDEGELDQLSTLWEVLVAQPKNP